MKKPVLLFLLILPVLCSCGKGTVTGDTAGGTGNSGAITGDSGRIKTPEDYLEENNGYYPDDYLFPDSDRESSAQEQQVKAPLSRNESLLSIVNTNLDLDGADEQIVILKVAENDELPVKVAVIDYDEIRSTYQRTWEAYTGGTNQQVIEVEVLDIIGDYSREIIIQGMKNKDMTLDVFKRAPSVASPGLSFQPICQLVSDGTIRIQIKKRSTTYELGQKTGDSFPIIVERRDRESGSENDMIRETYQWVYSTGKYQFIPPAEKIPGKIIGDKRFSELQTSNDPHVFENYLEGPWHSMNDISKIILFFPDEKQVVYYSDNTQEVYSWDFSSRRSNPLQLIIMIKNILIQSIKKTLNVTAKSLNMINISTNDEIWSGDFLKVNEELQESLYTKEKILIKPSEIRITGIFEEEFKVEGQSMQIVFEPPFFTWTQEKEGAILDQTGGFTVIKNIPLINDYYYRKHLQLLPETIDNAKFSDEILKNIKSNRDKELVKQYYQYNKDKREYQLKPNIDSGERTRLWQAFVSIQYKRYVEYEIAVISFKIIKENNIIEAVKNYIVEYAKEALPDGKGFKKTILLTQGNLFVYGIEAANQNSVRLVQYIDE